LTLICLALLHVPSSAQVKIADETQLNRILAESSYQQQMDDYNRRVKEQQDQHAKAMEKV
jgi:hypothetical protein